MSTDPWQVVDGEPVSGNDPFPGGPGGAGSRRQPPGHVQAQHPRTCVTTRPVPRVLREGRLVVPRSVDVEEPWSRMDLVVDVLRQREDLDTPGPVPTWTLRPEGGKGQDTWTFELERPLDWDWLTAHAVLPGVVQHLDDAYGTGRPGVGDAYFVVVSPAPVRDPGRRWWRR